MIINNERDLKLAKSELDGLFDTYEFQMDSEQQERVDIRMDELRAAIKEYSDKQKTKRPS